MSDRPIAERPRNSCCRPPRRRWWKRSTRAMAEGSRYRCPTCGDWFELVVRFGMTPGLPFPVPALFWEAR